MRRRIAYSVAGLGLALATAAPALAVPSGGANTGVIPVVCEGEVRHVLTSRGAAVWGADADGNADGTMYILKELTLRAYPGELTTQPDSDPIFMETTSGGEKTGLGEELHCTFTEFDPEGGVTIFGEATVVQVR